MFPYKNLYLPSRHALFVPINNDCRILARPYQQLSRYLVSRLVSFLQTGVFVCGAVDFLLLSFSV